MIFNGLIAPSGNEDEARNILMEKTGGNADKLGNLIVRKKGAGKKIVIACPIDEYGIFVSNADEKCRICPIGGIEVSHIVNCCVKFKSGVQGIICCDSDLSNAKFSDLYVEADGELKPGDIGGVYYNVSETEEFIMGSGCTREAVCEAVLSLMEKFKDTDFDIVYVFTSMYLIGKKGFHSVLLSEKPDFALMIDTVSDKVPGVKCKMGPVVKLMEGGYSAGEKMRSFAKKSGCRTCVMEKPAVSSANPVSFGADVGYISIPCRTINKTACKVYKTDIQKCAELAEDFIKNITLL